MIRQIAADTGQSAQTLRALNRRRLYTPPASLANSRNQDVDEVIADHIQHQVEEQRRFNDERLMAMHNELWREWFGENYDHAQFPAESAGSQPPAPTGSGHLRSVPTGSGDLRSFPTGSGDFFDLFRLDLVFFDLLRLDLVIFDLFRLDL